MTDQTPPVAGGGEIAEFLARRIQSAIGLSCGHQFVDDADFTIPYVIVEMYENPLVEASGNEGDAWIGIGFELTIVGRRTFENREIAARCGRVIRQSYPLANISEGRPVKLTDYTFRGYEFHADIYEVSDR